LLIKNFVLAIDVFSSSYFAVLELGLFRALLKTATAAADINIIVIDSAAHDVMVTPYAAALFFLFSAAEFSIVVVRIIIIDAAAAFLISFVVSYDLIRTDAIPF